MGEKTVERRRARAITASTFVAWWEYLLERAQRDPALRDDGHPMSEALLMFMWLSAAASRHGATQRVHFPATTTQEPTMGYRLHPGFPWENPKAAVRFLDDDICPDAVEGFVAEFEAFTGIKAEYREEPK